MYDCAQRPRLLEPQHRLPPVVGFYRRRTSRRRPGHRLRRRSARQADAPVSRSVTGIDSDPAAIRRATDRLASHRHVTVFEGDFQNYQAGAQRFYLITFVASLHHMDLRASLVKARDLLTPTGEIAVVGISANKTARDWVWSAMYIPAAR